MVRVLISGGTGTVARRLASILIEKNYDILLATRRLGETLPAPAIQVGNIDGKTDWKDALNQIDVVIHLSCPNN
jgi:nucleoside-diphosphate-sugar epimerase